VGDFGRKRASAQDAAASAAPATHRSERDL